MDLIEYLKDSIYWNLIYENRFTLILSGLKITIILTIASFILGTIIGILFCIGKGSRFKWVRIVTNIVTGFMISLPPLVLLMIFAYLILAGTGLSSFVIAIITFTFKCASHLSEMFRAAVDSVQKGEIEAARTLGFSRRQAFFHIVFPQALHQVMPLYQMQFTVTMQDTSVVSLLAVPDLTRSVNIITSRTLDPIPALIISTAIYLFIGFIGGHILNLFNRRRHLNSKEESQCQ